MQREKKERNKMIIEKVKRGEFKVDIAKEFNISPQMVFKIAKKAGLTKKYKNREDKKLEGRDYKRELIRKFFNYRCQKCGRVWKKGERRFDVHHFGAGSSKSKIYDSFADITKVTLLCHKCHMNLPEHKKAMKKPHQRSNKNNKQIIKWKKKN